MPCITPNKNRVITISKKKLNYLILFLLNSVQLQTTVVKFRLTYSPKLINLNQILCLSKRISKKGIQNSGIKKAHGHDMISISMLKICSKSIIKPLIYKNFIEKGCFPNEWTKANVVPVHKKDKQFLKNYRPISLLPVCSKVLERLL